MAYLSPSDQIQWLNFVLNILCLGGVSLVIALWYGSKHRMSLTYSDINRRLDHILLMTNEVFEHHKELKQSITNGLDDQKDHKSRDSSSKTKS